MPVKIYLDGKIEECETTGSYLTYIVALCTLVADPLNRCKYYQITDGDRMYTASSVLEFEDQESYLVFRLKYRDLLP